LNGRFENIIMSELREIIRWDSGPSPSGTDLHILYSHLKMDSILILNSSGSQMGWEYDDWYQMSSTDFSPILLELFVERPWNSKKQELMNKIPKNRIKAPV
jgi:hypothetical protein